MSSESLIECVRNTHTQNGRHERIHRTLQEDIVKHGNVQQRMYLQQRVFDQFRHKYNTERPHEALKNEVPASLYVPSSKRYPCALRSPEYPADWDVYLVRRDGSICVPGRDLFLSSVLVSEPVAFEPLPDGSMAVRYGPLKLGTLATNGRFVRGSRRSRRDLKATSEDLQAVASNQEVPDRMTVTNESGTCDDASDLCGLQQR